MMWFPAQQTSDENVPKTKPKLSSKLESKQTRLWFSGLVVLLLLLLCVLAINRLNHALGVTHWDIQAEPALQQQIDQFMQAQQQLSFWHSRAGVIQQQLLHAIADIEQVEVRRQLPDGLQIQATARQPLALWAKHDGQDVMLVDQRAIAYRFLKPGEVVDLPLLRMAEVDLKQGLEALQVLQREADRVLGLSEVIVEEHRWRLNFAHGEQWLLTTSNFKQDMGRIMDILEQPRWNHGYWRMDARIPQRWFIRPAAQGVI